MNSPASQRKGPWMISSRPVSSGCDGTDERFDATHAAVFGLQCPSPSTGWHAASSAWKALLKFFWVMVSHHAPASSSFTWQELGIIPYGATCDPVHQKRILSFRGCRLDLQQLLWKLKGCRARNTTTLWSRSSSFSAATLTPEKKQLISSRVQTQDNLPV